MSRLDWVKMGKNSAGDGGCHKNIYLFTTRTNPNTCTQEIKQTNKPNIPALLTGTSVLCTLGTCLSYLGPSQAPNLGTETNLKLSTYTGHIANTYIHTQGTTQGTKTRHKDKAQRQVIKTSHTDKAHRQGTQNKAK